MPDLDFQVTAAEVESYAAVPTLLFKLAILNRVEQEPIQAIMLRAQVRIAATQRPYLLEEEERLRELFGAPQQWGATLKSLLWTNTTLTVPPFTANLVTDLPIACTYDFEVVAAKYLNALQEGVIPLLFLFSGTILYTHEDSGLQIAQIPWEKEATFRLPVRLWRETMDRYFPNSAWLRLQKETFDRLCRYKARHALLTWEETLDRLLPEEARRER